VDHSHAIGPGRFATVLLDIDGTLIDSNGAHVAAWAEALRAHDLPADEHQLRRLIGVGSDKLLPAVAGVDEQSSLGQSISARKRGAFAAKLPALAPTPGARALLEHLTARGVKLAVATSAGADEVHAILRQAGVDDLLGERVTKDDAGESKPSADIVEAALASCHARPETTVLIGDTPYDIEAAARAGVASIAVRCGGYWRDEALRGAEAICDDPADLLSHWSRT
jgi:HAD superfamily hydrolase (TIGR01509 family)